MTVRVNKPAFNIREKLSELERPIGLKGSELMGSESVQDAREVVRAGRKNLIINGACTINQRFGSGTYTLTGTSDYYPVDRFRSWAVGGGQFTIQRSDDAPPGFKNSMMYTVSTVDTSVGTSEYYCVQQRMEGYNVAHLGLGTVNAKPVTLSFWVKSDLPGTYSGSFFNTGQSYTCVFEYQINQANTWEYKSFTIPAATNGSFTSDSSNYGLGIWWDLGSGTGFNNTPFVWKNAGDFRTADQVPFIATSGAKFRMTGVQLEVGRTATEFEHRSHGEELALCQRYFFMLGDTNNTSLPHASYYNNTLVAMSVQFPVTMRANPSIYIVDGTGYFGIYANNTFDYFNTFVIARPQPNCATLDCNGNGASGTAGHSGPGRIANSAARLGFNAEL